MKKHRTSIRLIVLILLISGTEAHAQLGGLLKKAKDKAGEIIENKTGSKADAGDHSKTAGKFIKGDSLIFAENFSGAEKGVQSKFNGTVHIQSVPANSGKWLALQEKTTYKFAKAIRYPKRFSIEFDVLATGEKIKDISPMSFGFATNNSSGEYTGNAGAYVEFHYYDGDQVNFGNSSPKKYINSTFELAAYLNRRLHVAIVINGQQMTVFLDGRKIQDGIFFNPSATKNFYFTAPWSYNRDAKVLVSNIQIYGFSK
ncbi:hypothetical protein [Pedobacter jeongneungensis]|uniref:hypothetical protein n=1 Tax=Pedobacter jeongneungensis TaxID=947309 RepID=UPI0004698823|nr:hypothetical protein [Pedobacter jeongneungensis]